MVYLTQRARPFEELYFSQGGLLVVVVVGFEGLVLARVRVSLNLGELGTEPPRLVSVSNLENQDNVVLSHHIQSPEVFLNEEKTSRIDL